MASNELLTEQFYFRNTMHRTNLAVIVACVVFGIAGEMRRLPAYFDTQWLFTIYMRKPFGSRFGVSKFRIVIFLSGLAFTICTNPSHLQRESGTGIKDEV